MQSQNATTTSIPALICKTDPVALIAALAEWLDSVLADENRGDQLGPTIECWSDESAVYIEAQGLLHERLFGDVSFCGDRVVVRLDR
jgi:hypothetical protein